METDVLIRFARIEDYKELTKLAKQLGYENDESILKERITNYINKIEKAIFVAECNSEVIGWNSVEIIDHFYIEPYVEISGFVVDEKHRNKKIGQTLMRETEKWTKDHGMTKIRLRTNSIRKDAHRFYERLGFIKCKEQIVYDKKIE
jgi:GNAT superfamily N-acetyltransferase